MPVIDSLFEKMIELGSSDLHLMESMPPKLRIHGSIIPIDNEPVLTEDIITSMLKEICPHDRWDFFRKNHDLDFAYAYGNTARFRANFYKQVNGLGAIFRIIPKDIKSLDDLKSPAILKKFSSINKGLILVTGPTGSGKSTTLAAIINEINIQYAKKILTIEEPIEFVHPNKKSVIVQREVGIDTPSFKSALYDATRSDVDVILVGEMRDLETINLAISAAEKGMLVFGTLHTNSASKTIDRIVDAFPAEQQKQILGMLSNSLYGVCSQLLCKTKDGKGRVAVHEIFVNNLSSSNLIREGQTSKIKNVLQTGAALGMIQMDDALNSLFQKGIISGKEAYMKAVNKDRFSQYINQ